MKNKKVSIIITCYNYGKYVENAIKSALNQTYSDIEIIIINDGSVDNSSDIIKTYADKYKNILFFDERENRGVVYSRNMGIEASRGDYILPLDADDTIEPEYVEKAVKILNENPKVGVVYCKYKIFGDDELQINNSKFCAKELLFDNYIISSSMFRKKDFLNIGKYCEVFNNIGCEDWDLWLSFAEKGFKFYCINEYLFNYRKTKNNKSRSLFLFNFTKEAQLAESVLSF